MKSLLMLAAVAITALTVTGCKSPGIFATSFNDGKKDMVVLDSAPIFPISLAVSEFKDLREGDNSAGPMFWSLCPLMPFGWTDYSRPENGSAMMNIGNYQYNLLSELTRAAAVSFNTSHLFSNAYYAGQSVDELKSGLILSGEVYATRFDGKLISYGVSVAAPALWVVGFPATHLTSILNIKLTISHRSTGKVVWERQFQVEDSSWRWAYGRSSEEIGIYNKLLRQELNKAIPEIEKLLSENQDLLDSKIIEKKEEQQLEKADVELNKSKQEQQEVKAATEAAKTM
jgi:hypothetical protein